jgi:tetratricopeptide (TPR) repeat protein
VVNLVFANAPEMLEGQALAGTRSVFSNDVVDKLPHGGVILAYDRENTALFFYRMLGEGYGSGKEWRVLQYSCWKHEKTDKRGIDPANDAATYDVSEVSRLLKGEAVEWGPLTTEDTRAGRHEAFFFHRDKAIMDMAGFISEPVDLKGDGDGKNRYGGAAVRLYRIVGTVKGKKPEEIIRTYDEGLSLLRRGAIEEARKIFQSLLDECNPDFAEAQFQVGMSYRGMRNYEEARRRWKIVLDLIPGYPPALDALQSLPLPRGQSIAEAGSHSVE